MHRYLIPAIFVSFTLPAVAGGFGEEATPPAVLPAAASETSMDWSGAYVGLQYGTVAGGNLSNPGGAFAPDFDGETYGVFAGYRLDYGRFVLGGEIDFMTGSGELSRPGLVLDVDYDRLIRAGVEAGWEAGQALIYGTAGFADIDLQTAGATGSSGYYYGFGVDYAVNERFVIGLEALKHEFSDFDGIAPAGSEADLTTIDVNLAIRF